MMINFNLQPVKITDSEVLKRVSDLNYDLNTLELYNAAIAAKESKEVGELILNEINKKCKLQLKFYEFQESNITAYDKLNRLHVIIGNWDNHRYFVRGVVRRKSKKSQMTWLCNGQASNSKQIDYFGENYTIEFSEIENATKNYFNMILKI